MFILLIYLLFQILLIFILILFILELIHDFIFKKVPYIPTSELVINQLINKLNINPKNVYDLGAGDARFLIMAKKKYPHAQAIGFEKSIGPYLLGKIKIILNKVNVKLYYKNFFNQNLNNADLIFCFLGPEQMEKLEIKFNRELKKNAIVISNTFPLPTWQPIKKFVFDEKKREFNKFYIYQQ